MTFNMFEIDALKKGNKEYAKNVKGQLECGTPVFHEVTLCATENDDYNELWYSENEDRYYIRHVFGTPVWSYVCDPLGYCERDYDVHDNHVFIVNNSYGVSNFRGACFPTLKETYIAEWDSIKANYPHFGDNETVSWWSEYFGNGSTMTTDKWLISFMNPAKYEKEIKDMYGYEENWVMHMKTIKREVIHTFKYLDKTFYIVKETQEHEICKKQIISYYVDEHIELGEWEGHVAFLDDYCEGKLGAMYTKREAIDKVVEALKEIYGGKQISKILCLYTNYYYERFISYSDAAKELIKSNNRKYIDALIRNERSEHSFFVHGDPVIEEKYPNYVKDHSYNYDHLGRRR